MWPLTNSVLSWIKSAHWIPGLSRGSLIEMAQNYEATECNKKQLRAILCLHQTLFILATSSPDARLPPSKIKFCLVLRLKTNISHTWEAQNGFSEWAKVDACIDRMSWSANESVLAWRRNSCAVSLLARSPADCTKTQAPPVRKLSFGSVRGPEKRKEIKKLPGRCYVNWHNDAAY